MSKASGWAAVAKERPRALIETYDFIGSKGRLECSVSDRGDLKLSYMPRSTFMNRVEALKLGKWLIETFGEDE